MDRNSEDLFQIMSVEWIHKTQPDLFDFHAGRRI